jgi:hypothetical protein
VNSASVGRFSSSSPDRRLYQSGPWLVVYGSGPDTNDPVNQVHEQCITHGVDVVLQPIGKIEEVRVDLYTALVVVLSSGLPNPSLALRSFTRLIGYYRARRPQGLASVINGSCEWFKSGVVQVIGPPEIMRHSEMRIALDQACARHEINAPGMLNVFQPYTRSSLRAQRVDEQPIAEKMRDENIERLWHDVQTWGVTSLQDVSTLRKRIDSFRKSQGNEVAERQGFSNQTWQNIIEELRKIVPGFKPPCGRVGTDATQKQLSRLYRSLRIIESYVNDSDK